MNIGIMYRALWLLMAAYVYSSQNHYSSYYSEENDGIIPGPIGSECHVSRLGNRYEAVVPHPKLQTLIDALNITISSKISANAHAELFHTVRHALP